MKAILKFNLPEDRIEFKLAQKGSDYRFALMELDSKLRSIVKYYDPETVPAECEKWDLDSVTRIREMLFETCEEYGIKLHEEYED
jgi:hypothetical protein